jgi:chemotaxis protein histidine kinase CheA
MAALIGLGVAFAWQSHSVWTMKPPNDPDIAAVPPDPAPARQASTSDAVIRQSAPVTQTAAATAMPAAAAPASSPELAKQLEAMTQDLISVRRGIEQLAAKQEQLAAAQKQLEQLAAKQEQLAAKQDQMAQNIAKLQTVVPNARPRLSPLRSPPPQSRAAPLPSPAPAAQLSSVPRSALHPVPPLPVPP